MRQLFLDTSYLIAIESADDHNHKVALTHWQDLSGNLPIIVTTSYIFDEVVTFFNNRNRHGKAVEIGKLLLESPSVKFIYIDEAVIHEAWRYFIQHSDKTYSFTDCTSFVVMKQQRIRAALTFDQHFVQAGFKRNP
jgi:predicted nucleic acid-binding protein